MKLVFTKCIPFTQSVNSKFCVFLGFLAMAVDCHKRVDRVVKIKVKIEYI